MLAWCLAAFTAWSSNSVTCASAERVRSGAERCARGLRGCHLQSFSTTIVLPASAPMTAAFDGVATCSKSSLA